jgi:hypothetical protein
MDVEKANKKTLRLAKLPNPRVYWKRFIAKKQNLLKLPLHFPIAYLVHCRLMMLFD